MMRKLQALVGSKSFASTIQLAALLSGIGLSITSCGSPKPIDPCHGTGCVNFSISRWPACKSAEDPVGEAITVSATSSMSSDDGNVHMLYTVVPTRPDGSLGQESELRAKQLPVAQSDVYLTCTTGRLDDGKKVLYSVAPKCAASKSVGNKTSCDSWKAEDRFPANWRFPITKMLPTASNLAERELVSASAQSIAKAQDCLSACKIGSETPICKTLVLPSQLPVNPPGGWSQALRTFAADVVNDLSYPITGKRMEQIFGVNPGDYYRGGPIFLNGEMVGQLGPPATLPFSLAEGNGLSPLKVEIALPEVVFGKRSLVDEGKATSWTPDAGISAPDIKFPERPDLSAVFGGAIAQLVISPTQFIVGNGKTCVALRY